MPNKRSPQVVTGGESCFSSLTRPPGAQFVSVKLQGRPAAMSFARFSSSPGHPLLADCKAGLNPHIPIPSSLLVSGSKFITILYTALQLFSCSTNAGNTLVFPARGGGLL